MIMETNTAAAKGWRTIVGGVVLDWTLLGKK